MFTLTPLRRGWRAWRRAWLGWAAVARRFLPFVARRRAQLGLAFGFGIAYAVLGLVEPWFLKIILDNVVLGHALPQRPAELLGPLAGDRLLLLNTVVVLLVVVALVRGLSYYYQQLFAARVGQQTAAAIRLELYRHLQSLSLSFHSRRRTGDLLTRLTNDVRQLRDIFISLPIAIVSELVLIVLMATVMFLMDATLTLLAMLVLPGIAILLRTYQRPMKKAIREQREREGQLATIAAEVLGAIRVVQGFRREPYEIDRFGTQSRRSVRVGLKGARLEAKLRWLAEVAVALVTALVLLVATRRVLSGSLSPGELLVFVAYLRTFNRPLRRISRMAERAARGAAAGDRLIEILDVVPGVADAPGAVRAPGMRDGIVFDDVSFAHRSTAVLRHIDLRIERGERLGIVGPTGSGKSTLVSLIPRFHDPDSGAVLLDGRDLREFTLASVREQVAFVFQEPFLFAATIAENIGYGRPDATRSRIVAAAEAAGIHGIISALPDGYDTMLGERGDTLSGGQRQCVAIARAIIKDAPIVVLDEPGTGLDVESASLVNGALQHLLPGRTVITISHQLASLRDVDRIIVMENGTISESGTHAQLAVGGGLYNRFQRLGKD